LAGNGLDNLADCSAELSMTVAEIERTRLQGDGEPSGYLLDRYNLLERAYVYGTDEELARAVQILIADIPGHVGRAIFGARWVGLRES
jgi:hypothetical protein